MVSVDNRVITVGTSSVQIAENVRDKQRELITFVNTSTGGQVITLSLNQYAVAGSGIVIPPNSSWSESLDSAFIPSNLRWYAISSGAGGTIAIQERLRD